MRKAGTQERRVSKMGRSVKDFNTETSLFDALQVGVHVACHERDSASETSSQHVDDVTETSESKQHVHKKQKVEGEYKDIQSEETQPVWALPDIDLNPLLFEKNTLSAEFNRLQVLKSFRCLDEHKIDALDTVTRIGSHTFDVPICAVSLVDMDRVWFVSTRGIGDSRETCRKNALCSYSIMCKAGIIVIPDTTKDKRFAQDAMVVGGPKCRFYAGAVLVSPEGYRIGNFGILDSKPHPQGLTGSEKTTLVDFATMTMKILVDRRERLHIREQREKLIANTAHDLMTPLTGLQLSLSVLRVGTETNKFLSDHETQLIETAENCSSVMARICTSSFAELREDAGPGALIGRPSAANPETEGKLGDLVNCLYKIMAPIPKKALLIISIGDTPPDLIVYNDLKVFRCALNFVSTACSRTHIGSVRLSIFVRDSKLIFECKDSAPDVTESDSSHLFRSENAENMQESAFADLHLSAYTIASMGGEYGFQPYNFADDELLQSEDRCKNGSLFWFNVPLGVQASKEDRVMPASPSTSVSVEVTATKIPVFATSLVNHPQKLVPSPIDKGQSDSAASISRVSAEMTRDRDFPRGGTMIEHCTTSFNTTKSKLSVEAIPQNVSGPLQLRQRKALVIDDSLVVRKTLARALSGMGYACTLAENGMEGLKELQDTIFDLSLCDFFMPVMDGLDCVKQYREWEQQHRPWFRQHIVGISAHASGNDAVVGAKLGLDDFKSKPVTIKTLKELGESQQVSVIAHHLDALASNHNSDETTAVISTDKTSISSQLSSSDGSENYVPICLIASLDFGDNTASIFKSNGWKCEVVRDCGGAMKLLKMRNWDAVLLDEALLPTSASHCTREFRQWEAENRVNRQNNLFLLCSMCAIDSNESVVVQAPCGFDGVICRRLRWDEFETMVLKNNGNEYPSPTSIITR